MTGSPTPKTPLNEQIADIVLKVIMTGGLAGGGVGAFWQLFKNSDIPRAVATAGIGLGLSYAAKMLMPVHKGNQRRLEQAGQAIDKGIDNVLELVTAPIIRNARGFENKYLLCQAAECQTLRSEGVPQQDKIFIPLLKEVFVPLALDSTAENLLAQIESQPALKSLARNPLLLNMIATFHRRVPGAELPKRKVELYGEICRLQLVDRPRARGVSSVITQCEAQGILQQVAFAMMQRHWERIPRSALLGALTKILKQQNESFAAKDFLDEVVQVSELLVQQEDEYEFAHLSFQEYLAAAYVAQTKREQLLYPHLKDDWWKSTILLYAGLVSPTQLMREAVNQGATDLAYQCLQETTKQVDAALAAELAAVKQTVVDARYADLEKYLKNGDWEKADNETYRLMITTVGKEEGQYFEPEELLEFPCEDLKAIDQLWVTHSKGKYGFSVQKKIYLSIGGIADGKYNIEAYQIFCNAVAWFKDGFYTFDKILMDGSGPVGHLPRPVVPRSWLSNSMWLAKGRVDRVDWVSLGMREWLILFTRIN